MGRAAKENGREGQRLRRRLEGCTEALLEGMQQQHREQEAENAALAAQVACLQQQLACKCQCCAVFSVRAHHMSCGSAFKASFLLQRAWEFCRISKGCMSQALGL